MASWLNLWKRADAVAMSSVACRARSQGDGVDEEPAPSEDEATPFCGWFESSFELQRGLAVVELHGTVRRRPAAAAHQAAAAAPAWSLT